MKQNSPLAAGFVVLKLTANNMDYILHKADGSQVTAEVERWGWGVVYKDGSELHQFDATRGLYHQFQEIVQDEVVLFAMYQLNDMSKRIDIPVSGKMQFFHFYRNLVLDHGTETERRIRIFVFGWKESRKGAHYHYILPDDRIVSTNHDVQDLTKFAI